MTARAAHLGQATSPAEGFAQTRKVSDPQSQIGSAGQWRGVSSFEQTAPVPVRDPSGDGPWAGSEPRSSELIARRSAFTGRVTYIERTSARGLRSRIPRPILASASIMAVAVGIAVSTSGASAPSTEPVQTLVAQPADVTTAPSSGLSSFR